MKKQILLILLLSITSSSLFARAGTGTIVWIKNELDTTIEIFRTEDKRRWNIPGGFSTRKINAWVPWCDYGRIQIKIGRKIILSFGEQNSYWVRNCTEGKLFDEQVKPILFTGGKYNLLITGTANQPKAEFYSTEGTGWEYKK